MQSNSDILTTNLLVPNVTMYDLGTDPVQPTVLYTFEEGTGLTSLTGTLTNVFEISAGSFLALTGSTTSNIESISAKLGSVKIYRLDLRSHDPVVTLTATVPDALQINNLATLNPTTILGSDSAAGAVWRIDTERQVFANLRCHHPYPCV